MSTVPNVPTVLGDLTVENVGVHMAGFEGVGPGTFSCHTIPFSDKTLMYDSMKGSVSSVDHHVPL